MFNLNLMLNRGYIRPTRTNSYQCRSTVLVLTEICLSSKWNLNRHRQKTDLQHVHIMERIIKGITLSDVI